MSIESRTPKALCGGILVVLLALIACSDDDDGTAGDTVTGETSVTAETTIADPEIFLLQKGQFVAPDRTKYEIYGSRTTSSEEFEQEVSVVVIGDRAWVNDGTDWKTGHTDDPQIRGEIGTGLGSESFFWGLDFSDIDRDDSPLERVNGVVARKVRLSSDNVDVVARILRLTTFETAELQELDDFTVWLAEDGGWPVALRMVLESTSYPFTPGDGADTESDAELEAGHPPPALRSFHYETLIAADNLSADSVSEEYRVEIVLAISRINDETIEITPPTE